MKKIDLFKNIVILMAAMLFLVTCKKTDDDKPNHKEPDKTINGGTIYRYGIVSIDLPSESLIKESYAGKIANKSIVLTRLDNNKLAFILDETIPFGDHRLTITDLNDLVLSFSVKDQSLPGTAQESIQPLFAKLQQVIDQALLPTESAALANVKALKEAFEKASNQHKEIMAKTYVANKKLIDEIISNSVTNNPFKSTAQRSTPVNPIKENHIMKSSSDQNTFARGSGLMANSRGIFSREFDGTVSNAEKVALLQTHMTAIMVMTVTGAGAALAVPYGPHTVVLAGVSAFSAGVAIEAVLMIGKLAFYYAGISLGIPLKLNGRELAPRIKTQTPSNALYAKGTLYAANNNTPPTSIDLVSDEDKSLSLTMAARSIHEGDKSSSNQLVKELLEKVNSLNTILGKLNTAITWINDNIPFVSYSTYEIPKIPTIAMEGDVLVLGNIVGKELKLSIEHPNLKVNTLSMDAEGNLLINVTIQESSEPFIDTELKYSFADDFSSFSGTIPVKVQNSISLVGTWKQVTTCDGDPTGIEIIQYNTLCPNIPAWRITYSGQVIFTSTQFSAIYKADTYSYNGAIINPETCELIQAGQFVYQPSQDGFSGTYILDGMKVKLTSGFYYGCGSNPPIFELIDENTLNIGGRIYEREM